MVNHARNRHGEIYPYFICLGRRTKRTTCTRQAILVITAEKLVEDHYRHVELTPESAQALADMLEDILDQINQESETERRDLTRQKERLEDEQLKLLQAHYAEAISLPILGKEQDRITGELTKISSRLDAHKNSHEATQTNLRAYLDLATKTHALYAACDEHHRRLLNQAFFTKVTITERDEVKSQLTGVYDELLDLSTRRHAEHRRQTGEHHPDVLEQNKTTLPNVDGGRVGTSNIRWS